MAQKQGGKGKQSSQSDKNYWARIKAAGGQSKRKLRNIARNKAGKSGAIDYGPKPFKTVLQRVVFSGTVKDNFPAWNIEGKYPPHFIIADGITIGVEERESDALKIFNERRPGSFAQVRRVDPHGNTLIVAAYR
jgi:hypothetical protein